MSLKSGDIILTKSGTLGKIHSHTFSNNHIKYVQDLGDQAIVITALNGKFKGIAMSVKIKDLVFSKTMDILYG